MLETYSRKILEFDDKLHSSQQGRIGKNGREKSQWKYVYNSLCKLIPRVYLNLFRIASGEVGTLK